MNGSRGSPSRFWEITVSERKHLSHWFSGVSFEEVGPMPSPYTWVSSDNVAPAANAVQADTGALAAGDYDLLVILSVSDTIAVGKGFKVEHRNAANSANIQVLGGCPPTAAGIMDIPAVTLALNERIRTIIGAVAGAASSRYISAIGRRTAV